MRGDRARPLEMDLLIREILFGYFRLNAVGERMFSALGLTPGKTSLMRSLAEEGPQSVAQIARARPVARQAVQRMADELARAGLVEFIDNPSHRRVKLARLSAAGKRMIDRAMAVEMEWAARLARHFERREVEVAREVVRRIIRILADEQFSPRTEAARGGKR